MGAPIEVAADLSDEGLASVSASLARQLDDLVAQAEELVRGQGR
jgi:hypothetical protein